MTVVTPERKTELFMTRGWCPVKWAHHPPEIKDDE